MKKTYNELIQEFINDTLFLQNYTKTENMANQNYEPKLTVKIGKRIEKNLQTIFAPKRAARMIGADLPRRRAQNTRY